jgi:predicted ATPase
LLTEEQYQKLNAEAAAKALDDIGELIDQLAGNAREFDFSAANRMERDAAKALLIIEDAINALLGLIESARRVEISAWTDDDQRGLNAAVADTMWHWDTRAERPLDPDDAVSLTEALKIHLKDNGFQIVRLATALAKDATT